MSAKTEVEYTFTKPFKWGTSTAIEIPENGPITKN